MKKSVMLLAASLAMLMVLLTGCEMSFDIGKPTTTAPATTAPAASETGAGEGTGATTEPVSLSASEQEESRKFYADTPVAQSGISPERVQESTDETKKSDAEILKSKTYTVTGRIQKNGETNTYRIAQNGNNYAVYCTYNHAQIGMIINDTYMYILMPETKSYVEISKAEMKAFSEEGDDIDSLMNQNFLDADHEVVKEGETTVEGQKVEYRQYDDGNTDYYKNGTLLMSRNKDGTVLYYDEISGTVSAGVFQPPKDYTKKALTIDTLTEISEMMGNGTTVPQKSE